MFPLLFHQSLKEGHDQEDNVSTDGGVTSDIESDVSIYV